MPTPNCKCCTTGQDDMGIPVSEADEDDMLEDTKPALISFTLSNSSSSATNGSALTNTSGHSSKENEGSNLRINGCDDVQPVILESPSVPVGNLIVEEGIGIAREDTPQTLTPDYSYQDLQDIECYVNSSLEDVDLRADTKLSAISTPNSRRYANKLSTNRSHSLHDLYQAPSFSCTRRSLMNTPSQSLLNVSIYSKSAHVLNQSVSSLSLKGRVQNYEHVQSKVKDYIQHLKGREKRRSIDKSTGSAMSNTEDHTNVEEQDSSKLLAEIRKLQRDVQERDEQLREVHANYQTLLLQHADAKNKLDRMRFFSSGVPGKKDIAVQVCADTVSGLLQALGLQGSESRSGPSDRESSGRSVEVWPQAVDCSAAPVDAAYRKASAEAQLQVSSWCSSLPPAAVREAPGSEASGSEASGSPSGGSCDRAPALHIQVCECWGVDGPCAPPPCSVDGSSERSSVSAPCILGVPPLNLSWARPPGEEEECGPGVVSPPAPAWPPDTPTTYKSIHVQQWGVLAAHVPRSDSCRCPAGPVAEASLDLAALPPWPEVVVSGAGDVQPLLSRALACALQLQQRSEAVHQQLAAALQPDGCV